MPVYTTVLVDNEGRLDPNAFRQAFLLSLQQHNYDVNAFLLPPRIASSNRILPVNQNTPHILSVATLEELSEDDEEESTGPRPSLMLPGERPHRLKLVVDLDNTLVHAQSKYKLNGIEPELYDFRDAKGSSELFRFVLPKHQGQAYYLKLRPGAVQFLRDISVYYDVAVHTNATQEYADVVLSVLDPDRSVIGLRVVARDDESSKDERKDMSRLYVGDREKLLKELLILDDRRDVWDSQFEKNIIQCHYYEYFETRKEALTRRYPTSGETGIFRPYVTGVNYPPPTTPFPVTLDPGSSTNDVMEELFDDDRQLFFIKELMKDIAEEWYRSPRDITEMLAERRSKILAGCVVLMTGYHKVEQASQYGMLDNGPQHRRRLEFMGATVTEQAGPDVTHVIVMRQTVSTDRARTTCGKNTKFVHNLWIYACEHAWTKVDESLFEATSVLNQFQKPSTRPLSDHWKRTKDYTPYDLRTTEDELQASTPTDDRPVEQDQSSNLTSVIGEDQGSEDATTSAPSTSNSQQTRKRRLSHDERSAGGILRRRRLIEIAPLPSVYGEHVWPSSGPWSNGAEVWSALEHVVLRYDSFLFEQIRKKSSMAPLTIT